MILFLKVKNWINQKHLSKQIILFLIVGTISTIISYTTFIVALRLLNLHYLVANICGFILSIGFNYHCNKRWTFGSKSKNRFPQYFFLYFFSLILSSILLKIFVEYFGIIPEVANILTIALITFSNFCGVKFFVFNKKF